MYVYHHPHSTCPLTATFYHCSDLYSLLCLQCFDTVGWAAGRASGLKKSGDGGSDENKVIRIAKCDVFSGACESIWYLRAFWCESLYAMYTGMAASYLSACRAAVGLFPTSNAIVERCFSTMPQVKTDWRNKLGAKSLEHLLRITCAGPECVSNEFQRLLASSVDRYFRRKCRRPNSMPYGPRAKKVKVTVEEFDGVTAVTADSDSESEPIKIAESDADTDTAI